MFRIHLELEFDFSIAIARRSTLALFIGGEPHHGATTPRASCDRRADGGNTGNSLIATRPTFHEITVPVKLPAPTATATSGGKHHDGPRYTFARSPARGAPSSRRGPRSFTLPESPRAPSRNSARHFVGLSPWLRTHLSLSNSGFHSLSCILYMFALYLDITFNYLFYRCSFTRAEYLFPPRDCNFAVSAIRGICYKFNRYYAQRY